MIKITQIFENYRITRKIRAQLQILRISIQDLQRRRSSHRLLNAAFSTATLAFAKGLQFLFSLVSVPVVLHYLGKADYGMVVATAGIAGWFAIGDFGIGLGVKNSLIEAYAHDDKPMARAYVSTGLMALSVIALLLAVVFAVTFPLVPWIDVIRVDPAQYSKLDIAITVSSLLVFVSIPLNVVRQIYSAEQREYKNSLWTILGICMGLLVLLTTVWLDWGVIGVILGLYGMNFVSIFLCGIYIFAKEKSWLRPSWRFFNKSAWQRIWSSGAMFFIVQLGMIGIFQSGVIIVSSFLGVSRVPDYSVPSTLFTYIGLLVSFIVSPFWAAFGEAGVREDWYWIKRYLRRLIGVALTISFGLSIVLILIGPQLISYLTNGIVIPSREFLLALGLYTTAMACLSVYSVLLNGLNCLRIQATAAIFHALLNVIFAMILVQSMGIVGVALAAFASTLLTSGWILPLAGHWILQSKFKVG